MDLAVSQILKISHIFLLILGRVKSQQKSSSTNWGIDGCAESRCRHRRFDIFVSNDTFY